LENRAGCERAGGLFGGMGFHASRRVGEGSARVSIGDLKDVGIYPWKIRVRRSDRILESPMRDLSSLRDRSEALVICKPIRWASEMIVRPFLFLLIFFSFVVAVGGGGGGVL
jgi:hypothetical protein